jgi:hypothetical protein
MVRKRTEDRPYPKYKLTCFKMKKTRSKNIFVFCAMLLLAAAVYVWFYPLNKGVLIISSGAVPYSVTAGEMGFECAENPCPISLRPGFYNLEIKKDKYLTDTVPVNILRGKTTEISAELRKNPVLAVSAAIPPDENTPQKSLPEKVQSMSPADASWNTAGNMLAFIDKTDDKLKIFDQNETIKTVTPLKNMGADFKLYWSPDNQYLFGAGKNDIYFIDIQNAARKKMSLGFAPVNIKWFPASPYLLVNDDENGLYKIDIAKKIIEPIAVTLPMANALWEKEGMLIFFTYDSEAKKTDIKSFDLNTGKENKILTQNNFATSKITSDKDGNIYFYNHEEKTWYNLDY